VSDYRKKFGKMPVSTRAELRRASCCSIRRCARQGDLRIRRAWSRRWKKADFRLDPWQVQLQHQSLSDPELHLLKTVTGPAGQDPVMEIQKTVFTNHKDSYSKNAE